ncbi:hypothetical protein FDT66_13770 [Polaribacter aestuariivivens]|uniref:Uncharacterized protein n=2 Tax=Polaribacter aestuariivivens TaxID=2304626 RepID=A0A5S3N717_9FLAO|nr:hypothetical protein FDT66_13770 [Polaribacter aestuariivivens]
MKKITFLIVLIFIISCSSPLDKKFNENTSKEDLMKIQSKIDSTQFYLLAGSMLRLKLQDNKIENMTYREILEQGEKWKVEEEKRQEELKRLAEKARKEQDERTRLLSESIIVSCFEKGFTKYNYEDYITYKFVIKNKSVKNIRAVKGSITFMNLFDQEIKTLNLVYDESIKANSTVNYNAQTDYNQFKDSDKALKNKDLKDMKVKWNPEKIIFEDGTTLE